MHTTSHINNATLVEFSRSRDESVDIGGGYESGGGRLISNCDRAIPNYLLIRLKITSCTHSLILITSAIPNHLILLLTISKNMKPGKKETN